MTDREMLELAAKAGAWTPMGLPSDWQTGDVVFSQDELRKFAALVRQDALEEAAVRSWSHYMDTCKKAGFSPVWFDKFIAADAIRALAASPFPKSGG